MPAAEGSGCFGLVFLAWDAVRPWRSCISSWRALLRGDICGRFFLIPCGRASIEDQSKISQLTRLVEWHTFVFWHRVLSPDFLGVSVCLTRGHIDWKEEG
jgi:hypothetical protein